MCGHYSGTRHSCLSTNPFITACWQKTPKSLVVPSVSGEILELGRLDEIIDLEGDLYPSSSLLHAGVTHL